MPALDTKMSIHLKIYLTAIVLAIVIITVVAIIVYILSPDALNRDCAKVHNYYRYKHRSGSLSVSKTLVEFAQKRAEELKTTDIFQHPKDIKYGENLYKQKYFKDNQQSLNELTCEKAVKLWYNEIKNYDYEHPKWHPKGMVGHFTQVVWTGTKKVGCAKSYSNKSFSTYLVCNYEPAGNWVGSEKDYVPKVVS